jgi:hypothetical protein
MTNEQLISKLEIPSSITPDAYPKVKWVGVDGNAFALIGKAQDAWRKVDPSVAGRIAKVLMQSPDYSTLLSVCLEICPHKQK